MNTLSRERQIQVISALVEGSSIRSAERMTGVHRDTIMRLLYRTGVICSRFLDERMRNLRSRSLQIDEIWTFVGMKQKQLIRRGVRNELLGDQYVFVAIDADTKLIPTFHVGKRDGHTAREFCADLSRRIDGRVQISTDAFDAYAFALGNTFGLQADYAQVSRIFHPNTAGRGRYAPPAIIGTTLAVQWGTPDQSEISTSYVERQNLTMRMQVRRLTRLTNGFSKKFDNLVAALNLHFAWYNFVRIHKTTNRTPAVCAGIAHHSWSIGDLIGSPD